MKNFILGNIFMACFIAGLFFLRFWRQTRDRLFLMFALAFWTLSASRFALVVAGAPDEIRTLISLARLAAFILILAAILDKNRRA
jgi:Ca2+/Na+ antiporter